MNKRLTEQESCTTTWDVLQERLGPVEGMRRINGSLGETAPSAIPAKLDSEAQSAP